MYFVIRRCFDTLLAVIMLLVLLPILLIISLAIIIDSRGGVIFKQLRIGKNGKPYAMLKFRTMVPNAQNMGTGVYSFKDDPRITKVGRFLRKTSLDELPQLWNILRGDMSFVGPRPPLPRETDMYTEEEWKRLSVTPGLTCYWQIQPRRNSLSFKEWLALDMKYIQERNYLVDWKIMFSTVRAVVKMEGE